MLGLVGCTGKDNDTESEEIIEKIGTAEIEADPEGYMKSLEDEGLFCNLDNSFQSRIYSADEEGIIDSLTANCSMSSSVKDSEKQGYLEYTVVVSYAVNEDLLSDEEKEIYAKSKILISESHIYDYYTGQCFDYIPINCVEDDGFKVMKTKLNDTVYTMYSKYQSDTNGSFIYTVLCPKDYDGVVLGVVNPTLKSISSEGAESAIYEDDADRFDLETAVNNGFDKESMHFVRITNNVDTE